MLVTGLLVAFVGDSDDASPVATAGGPIEVGDEADASTTDESDAATSTDVGDTGPATPSTPVASGGTRITSVATGAPSSSATTDTSPLKVGFTLFDIAGAGSLGFAIGVDPEDEREAYQAFVDHVNATGGINGRRIEPLYSTYDLTNQDSQHASCLELTDDGKVFAVIGGYSYSSANLCVVEQNKTLLVNHNSFTIDELYRTGRHVSIFAKGDRMMATFARRLAKLGHVNGKRVGILADNGSDPSGSVMNALARAVESHGGTVARRSMLNGEFASGSSQIPVEVNQMRTAGVQLVLLIASPLFGTQFAQQADSQQFRPLYAGTDWQAMYSDVAVSNMPDSFEAFSVTTVRTGEVRANIPEGPKAVQCREIFERMAKEKLAPRGEDNYGLVMQACDAVLVFAAAARAASPLTHATFVSAIQGLGTIDSAAWGGGTFRPGKLDLNDNTRINRFSNDCKCWMPTTPFTNE